MKKERNKFVPIEKASKKERKRRNAAKRTYTSSNIGVQIHKTDKYPIRARAKEILRNQL